MLVKASEIEVYHLFLGPSGYVVGKLFYEMKDETPNI